ncbi:MFS family permease [Nocardioides thalensis]|uniref:MFS family permease n=1 Tax=Nocardioides thalensis TaxID=1914755 RepID=A0A853CAP8_9ACTN|nr:MFS family permease [Nocardioides thalensis]
MPPHALISVRRRWAILAAGTLASAASTTMVTGPAFLIPELHAAVGDGGRGLSLAAAGLVAAATVAGQMVALLPWGFVVDRRGERFALVAGLSVAVLGGIAAILAPGTVTLAVALFFAGIGGASANSASGRVVVGWFPPERRGLAMGIRQAAQPIGVGLGAATMAVLAADQGIALALGVPTVACALAILLVLVIVLDPPRPPRAEGDGHTNPYRVDGFLVRVHAASVLLVVPQFLVWAFGLTWLVTDLGWEPGPAGLLIAGTQVAGAAARISSGWVSDLVGSRMRPMRVVAVLAALTLLLLGSAASLSGGWWTAVAVALLVVASAVTVADNGLAYTAIAEKAGPFWSGRALGAQNTAQHAVAALVPPLFGLLITHWGYGAAYALAAVLPLLAIGVVPVHREQQIR